MQHAWGDVKCLQNFRKPEGKWPLIRPKCRRNDKMYLKVTRLKNVNWIDLAQDSDRSGLL
jgi:hypothetical protein